MIRIQLNGKTRDISLEDYLTKDIQELIAEDIGFENDELMDFNVLNFTEIKLTEEIPDYPVSQKKLK